MQLPQEINGYPVMQAGITGVDQWIVICRRSNAPFADRLYNTWFVYVQDGKYVAEHGHYDMTLERAREDWQERMSRALKF